MRPSAKHQFELAYLAGINISTVISVLALASKETVRTATVTQCTGEVSIPRASFVSILIVVLGIVLGCGLDGHYWLLTTSLIVLLVGWSAAHETNFGAALLGRKLDQFAKSIAPGISRLVEIQPDLIKLGLGIAGMIKVRLAGIANMPPARSTLPAAGIYLTPRLSPTPRAKLVT